MTTKPIASEGLIERLRDPEYMEGHGVSAKVADEAADALESTNRQLLLYREALSLAVPIIEEDRQSMVDGHTVLYRASPDLGKVVDPDAVEAIEQYDAALNAARKALEGSCPDVVGRHE